MKTLGENWITERLIDFEYKKYVLLAYLQSVNEEFEGSRLYPALSSLVAHYRNLISLKENKQLLYDQFPERIRDANFEKFRITFEKVIKDDAVMKEIENIIDFSMPQFEYYLGEGRKIYDLVEEHLNIFPVGIIPLQAMEGYMFLKNAGKKEARVYEYRITIFEKPDEKYRGIHTQYIDSYRVSISNTFESIKTDLLRSHRNMPNPATYAVESDLAIPFEETFLPVAKRSLLKYVSARESG